MEDMSNEKLAFFAFSFVILAVGGPCGFLEKYLTVGNATAAPLPNPTNNQSNQTVATHFACENSLCVETAGAGPDECASHYDCTAAAPAQPLATHLACLNNACVHVPGAGTDDCSSDTDCMPLAPAPSACSVHTDCSSCLKTVPGECKWCIQGSICAATGDNTQVCTFGPTADKWLAQDYQCGLATR